MMWADLVFLRVCKWEDRSTIPRPSFPNLAGFKDLHRGHESVCGYHTSDCTWVYAWLDDQLDKAFPHQNLDVTRKGYRNQHLLGGAGGQGEGQMAWSMAREEGGQRLGGGLYQPQWRHCLLSPFLALICLPASTWENHWDKWRARNKYSLNERKLYWDCPFAGHSVFLVVQMHGMGAFWDGQPLSKFPCAKAVAPA